MGIPTYKSMELPLLHEIEAMGGSGQPKELYDRVAQHFPGLTASDRKLVTPKTKVSTYNNRVQFVRMALINKGELDGHTPGVWTITQKGKDRLSKEWPLGFVPEYCDLANLFIDKPSTRPVGHENRSTRKASPSSAKMKLEVPPTPNRKAGAPVLVEQPKSVREQLLAKLHHLSPRQFEYLVAEFLRTHGLADVRVTSHSHDGGIDGYCTVPFLEVKVGFQAKRFGATTVGVPVMQHFKGSLTFGQHERGIFVTTSDFTQGAIEVAEGPGVPVILVSGKALVEAMLEKRLGIKEIVTSYEIDEAFFDSLTQ